MMNNPSKTKTAWSRSWQKHLAQTPWCIMALAMIFVTGCAPKHGQAWTPAVHSSPDYTLLLSPGDEITISFVGAESLSTAQTIRRDGKVSLRLLGEIMAAGKAPSTLERELKAAYTPHLQIAEVSVIVSTPAPMYIGGAVRSPGVINAGRPITALEAIMEVGGFDETQAEVRNVLVIRQRAGKRIAFALDFSSPLKGEEDHVFYLDPLDIVYVPRTRIVKVNQWVDQYINGLIPSLPFSYLVN